MELIKARIADIETEQTHQRRGLEGFPQSDNDESWCVGEATYDENTDYLDSDSNRPSKLKVSPQ